MRRLAGVVLAALVVAGTPQVTHAGELGPIVEVSGGATGAIGSVAPVGLAVAGPPVASVTLPDSGGVVEDSLVTRQLPPAPAPPAIGSGLFEVRSAGQVGPEGHVESRAQRVSLEITRVPLRLGDISATCRADRFGASGSTEVVRLESPLITFGSTPAPNTVVDLPGVGRMILNEQIVTDAASRHEIVVNGMRLVGSGGFEGEMILAQARCRVDITATAPPPVIPEVPSGAMMPAAGLATVAAIGLLAGLRRRRRAQQWARMTDTLH